MGKGRFTARKDRSRRQGTEQRKRGQVATGIRQDTGGQSTEKGSGCHCLTQGPHLARLMELRGSSASIGNCHAMESFNHREEDRYSKVPGFT